MTDLTAALALAKEALTAERTTSCYPVGWIASDTNMLAEALLALHAATQLTPDEREALEELRESRHFVKCRVECDDWRNHTEGWSHECTEREDEHFPEVARGLAILDKLLARAEKP